jgi:hypothetical protein
MGKEIKLVDITTKTAVRVMMEDSSYHQFQDIAKDLGKAKSTFQSWLDNDSLRVRDLKEVADKLGYEVIIRQK